MKRIAGILLAGAVVATVLVRVISGVREPSPKPPSDLTVPSGQVVTLIDTVQGAPGPEGLTLRFRFLAPGIARAEGAVSVEKAQADMAHLCTHYALPRVSKSGPAIQQIVISLSDRAVPFGESDPEATQYFEAFSIADGTCIWEAF
jgi:hypothetical protein